MEETAKKEIVNKSHKELHVISLKFVLFRFEGFNQVGDHLLPSFRKG
jgi:hypothetical protein